MAGVFDFKKEYADLYLPKAKPGLIDVPEMLFIMIDGRGDPNRGAEYKNALEILYGLSYAIKMSKMGGKPPAGYFEYVVPPLEGLWWLEEEAFDGISITDKEKFCWTSMIRQPQFVTPEVFAEAKQVLAKKKPALDLSPARRVSFTEGLCAQIMHIGSYDDEPATIGVLRAFITEAGYESDLSEKRRHHEIYLSDPRKTAPEKLKTVIRHPVAGR
ncbi:MAG: GyrI-like domain-containing protein [Clostridiales bacterium]|nr:GyrI-like domain-containing protein [Clostridiales bacterium]